MNSPIVPLGEIIAPAPSRRAGNRDYALLSMTMRNGLVEQSQKFNKRIASRETYNYRVVKRGELVVGFPIDEAVLATLQIVDEGIVSPAYAVWSINPAIADPAYLERFLRSDVAISYYKAHLRGTTARRRTLPPDKFRDMPVPLPSLERQRHILAILDKATTICHKRGQELALADDLLRSVFLEMFGDPVQNPKNWERRPIGDLCSRVTVGIVVQPASYYVSDGIPALRSLNVREDYIDLSNVVFFSRQDNEHRLSKTRLRAGDVVVVRSGQPGKAAIVPKELDGINAIDILIASPKSGQVTSEYLCSFLNSPGGRQIVMSEKRGQIQKHLNVGSLKSAEIPAPPLDLLQIHAQQVHTIQKYRKRLADTVADAANLYASLSQRAFRGEL